MTELRHLAGCLLLLLAAAPLPAVAEPQDAAPGAQEAIGWRLFFDARLSRNGNVACATCHDPQHGWSDGQRFSQGTHGDTLARNTPGILHLGKSSLFFWDGRASSLEEQAMGPMTHPQEMGMSLDEVVQRVRDDADYRKAFARLGTPEPGIDDIVAALAAFQRGLRGGENAYDRWLLGDTKALDRSQSNGRFLFFTRAQCATCHIGEDFSDHRLHNIGTGTPEDTGRHQVTGLEEDKGRFKTPSLRNWKGGEPFMHDGRFATIAEVIDFYADPPPPLVGKSELDPLGLSERDKRDLLAFMEALNGAPPDLAPFEAAWQALLAPGD